MLRCPGQFNAEGIKGNFLRTIIKYTIVHAYSSFQVILCSVNNALSSIEHLLLMEQKGVSW